MCTCLELVRKRKSISFRLDEGLIEVLDIAARMSNDSRNRYLEKILIEKGKELGILESNFEALGETRGGDRGRTSEEDEK